MARNAMCLGLDSTGFLFMLAENFERKEVALLSNCIVLSDQLHLYAHCTVKIFLFLVREDKQEHYCNKSLSFLDEKHFRIFISYYNLFIKYCSLAL